MNQPIQILYAGSDPVNRAAAEILRCEGFPWIEEHGVEDFDGAAPGVSIVVVAGTEITVQTARRLATMVAQQGVTLVALAPAPALARALGITIGAPVVDAHLTVVDLPRWEHGDMRLLCPDDTARPLTGAEVVAAFDGAEERPSGAGILSARLEKGRVWFYGYDLCRTILTLRHGTGQLDPPEDRPWRHSGPRAMYGFQELSAKLPHDVPVADLHQDILRSILTEALADTAIPRLWHFPEAAPAMWFIRTDGCGEAGLEVEIEVMEKRGAVLSFYRPLKSRYSGEQIRAWHKRGHGMAIEANITNIACPESEDGAGNRERKGRPAAEINAHFLPAIRENLQRHRDSFIRETGLQMEAVLFHAGHWTGLPMARLVRELGWPTALGFQSHDLRIWQGDRKGPYMVATALPMRYLDRDAGVIDLWYPPHQHIDMPWQGLAKQMLPKVSEDDPELWQRMLGQLGEVYGAQLARFAKASAQRWHGAQMCTFHSCYVASPRPHIGTSKLALEMALEGARAAGCRIENVERFSRFFRARADVRLASRRVEAGKTFLTLSSEAGVEGLTLILPDVVKEVWLGDTGEKVPVREVALEGRTQRAVVVNLKSASSLKLCLG